MLKLMINNTFNRVLLVALSFSIASSLQASQDFELTFLVSGYGWTGNPNNPNGEFISDDARITFNDTLLRTEDFSSSSNSGHREFYQASEELFYSPFEGLLSAYAGTDLSVLPGIRAEIEFTRYFPSWQRSGRTQAVMFMTRGNETIRYNSHFVIDLSGVSFGSVEEFFQAARTGNVYQNGFTVNYALKATDGYFYTVNGFTANSSLLSFEAVSTIPEPEVTSMMLTGLGLIGATIRRRKQAAL